MSPIVCVGETDKERDAGETFGRVGTQLDGGLAGITAERGARAWSSPTSRCGPSAPAAPPRRPRREEVHAFIRGKLAERWGDVAEQVRIQYGGSVKPDNARLLLEQPDIDGALVGGASLKADDFLRIVKYRQ